MSLQQIGGLYIARSRLQGRGVFCAQAIGADDVIEICPVILLAKGDTPKQGKSVLYDYYFAWGDEEGQAAIALGYGSLYNHSSTPNAQFTPDYAAEQIVFTALQNIPSGTEITVDYHAGSRQVLWFEEIV